MEKSYKEIMPRIDTFIFDVDGVLTNGMVTIFPDGELVRSMHVKDGFAIRMALHQGFKVFVVSGGTNESVRIRLRGLGIEEIYLGISDKLEKLHEITDAYSLNTENILYMGDDLPDYEVMSHVGLPCCPKDAAPEIQHIANYISQKRGGNGCVRDVIEQVMKVQDKWHPGVSAIIF